MDKLVRLKSLLQELTQLPGVSGKEQPVVRAVRRAIEPYADEVHVDSYGNIIATRNGSDDAPRMMIAAHSDEVGGVITAILPSGFLRFQSVGVVSPTILPATRVRVANRYVGVISSIPGHLNPGDAPGRVLPASALHIDVGAENEAQVREWGIREGASVVFESPLVELENATRVMGKAIDNRVGCAVLISVFEELAGKTLPVTLYGVVNVLEEIGMRGARMTSARLQPDFAIALDTVPADDTPLSNGPEMAFGLGCGPVIQLCEGKAEQFLGTVAHPDVRDLILSTAQSEKIPVQLSAAYGHWTTDGAAIHTTGQGIPTGFVSVPRRYAHTPNEMLDLTDAVEAARLLTAIAGRTGGNFNPDFLASDE